MSSCRYLLCCLALSISSMQATVLLNISNPIQNNITPGTPVTFLGSIANNTGEQLSSNELFLSFSGFDPGAISLFDDIGATPFTVADGNTAPLLDVFTATLSPSSEPGMTYSADAVLQDIYGDVAPPVTVSFSNTPEPASLGILASGLMMVVLGTAKRGRK